MRQHLVCAAFIFLVAARQAQSQSIEQESSFDAGLVAAHSTQCRDVNQGSTAKAAAILSWMCNGGRKRLWAIQTTAPQIPPVAQSPISPVSASVVVRFLTAKAVYHIGEEILLELEFRGTGDKDYYFSTAACGFFGRLFWFENLAVTPSDGIDNPLADLFSSGGQGGSCPFIWHALDDTPLVIRVSMNDAVRFTRPGTYTVVVSSTRLRRYSRQPAPVLTSAPVDLTIAPMDDAWAAAEVGRASTLIGRGDTPDVRHGAAMLRYLGTQAAALALVERYDIIAKANVGEVTAGLISSSYRAFIISQMEGRVDQGGSLDASFLNTLTELRVLLELPATPGNAVARRERTPVVQAEYDARWRAAIARHPVTAATLGAELARFQTNPSVELQQQIASDLEQHPAQAAEAFVALPPNTLEFVLQSATVWPYLSRPWVVTPLRQVYAQSHGRGNPGGLPTGPGDPALRRLYELVPDEGRRSILEEIRTGEHGISYSALAILPEAELPELDTALQARYSSAPKTDFGATLGDRGTTAWLMARYGSASLLPFVTGLLARPLPSCVVEGGLVAYLLKHDPAAAMKRLDPTFDRTAPATCVAPLTAVADHYWDDRVESVALAQLMVADVRNVIDAAQLLGSHGSSAVKQPLIDRLATWSAEWQGRASELVDLGPGVAYPPQAIENNLVNALFHNERFALTKDDVANMRTLCLTDQCRTDVDMGARSIK
jgi:hypothetical protein